MKQVSDFEDLRRLREIEDMIMRQLQNSAAGLLAATVACGLFSQTASAQFSSTTRTGSTSGNALTSGSSTGTGGTGSTSTSGFGGAVGGAGGGAANAAVGGNNAANRTAGNGQAALQQSLFTQGNNQNGFIGGRNQQQGFIGGNQRTGQQQNNRQQQQNNRQGGFGQNDPNNMNQGQQNQDQRRAIRPSFKVAFDQPQKPTADIRSTLQPRFDSLSQTPSLHGVAYELDADGVVVLRGTVETPAQKRLAENVVKLEPGVKKVRNELTLNEKE